MARPAARRVPRLRLRHITRVEEAFTLRVEVVTTAAVVAEAVVVRTAVAAEVVVVRAAAVAAADIGKLNEALQAGGLQGAALFSVLPIDV